MRIDRRRAYELAPQVPETLAEQIFAEHPHSEFALLPLGMGSTIAPNDAAADVWHRLRYNIYDAHGYLGRSTVTGDREFDSDDDRAIHLLVLKQLEAREAVAVAGMRCIIKDSVERPLPIEDYFAPAFAGNPAPINAIETSRLIAIELDLFKQRRILSNLFAVAYADTLERVGQFRYSYGVMGADLEATLPKFVGLPIERIADEMPVPYGTDDIAIRADMETFRHRFGESQFRTMQSSVGQILRWGSVGEESS